MHCQSAMSITRRFSGSLTFKYGWVKVQKFGVRLLEGLAPGVRSD